MNKDYLSYELYENFTRNRSKKTIFRYPLIEDHLARYNWAREIVDGGILDVACGSGFGSNLMARTGHSVVGIDINPEAFEKASTYELAKFFQFNLMSPRKIIDGKPSYVTAFEIIEHFDKEGVAKLLETIRSLVKDDTKIYFSTPNTKAFSPTGKKWLPYHPIEYSFETFEQVLNENGFKVVRKFGQRKLPFKTHQLVSNLLLFPVRFMKDQTIDNRFVRYLYGILARLELFMSGFYCNIEEIKGDDTYYKYFIFEVRKA